MKKLLIIITITFSIALNAAEFEVFKSPNCGCCQKWVDALEEQGHEVITRHIDNLHKIKFDAGVPVELGACHTAFVDGYVVEGHVPIEAIDDLLKNKPDIKGIAVPGMPGESLGMEQGGQPQPYVVYGFDNDKNITAQGEFIGTKKIR